MAHINEVPQPDGTVEYDVEWTDAETGMKTRCEADSRSNAMRGKGIIEASGHRRSAAVKPILEQLEAYAADRPRPTAQDAP